MNERLPPPATAPTGDLSRHAAPLDGCVDTTTNARLATEVEWKVVLESWSSTCGNVHGFGLYVDGQKNKAEVMSGLFGLITAKLEDAHDASVVGQGTNVPDEERKAAINNLRTAQDEIAILLSAIVLLGCSTSA